jgi:sterol desaturase/sphingolipid hydroxylase (fatty acid hydroxylase superfamily)
VTETVFQATKAAAFALSLGTTLLFQRLSPHAALRVSRPGNLGLFVVNSAVAAAACGGCAWGAAEWSAGASFGLMHRIPFPMWGNVAATVAVLDLVSYGWHRANHRVDLLWRFHQVHHSDAQFTATTALRFHPGELLASLPLRLAAVALLGADPVAVLVFETVFGFANLFEHGDIDLPARLETALGRGLITPALHRRHHSRRPSEQDSNFGTIFAVWDRLFGTFGAATSATVVDTGLAGFRETPGLLESIAMPRRSSSP